MFVKLLLLNFLFYGLQAIELGEVRGFGDNKGAIDKNAAKQVYDKYLEELNKNYDDPEEYETRFENFLNTIASVNLRIKQIGKDYFGITIFADVSEEEFRQKFTEFSNVTDGIRMEKFWKRKEIKAPTDFDWRSKNAVTPVKNQGNCNSCWSFGATGVLEGQYAIKNGPPAIPLSEQQMLDCYHRTCRTGGYPHLGMQYVQQQGGIMSEASYSYAAMVQQCRFDPSQIVLRVLQAGSLGLSEEQLVDYLVQNGPIAVGINADGMKDVHGSQVIVPNQLICPYNAHANHAVLLIGYGVENNVPYWLLKNSWTAYWGDQGYFKIVRGRHACCMGEYSASAIIT